jgi:hypothetical protein
LVTPAPVVEFEYLRIVNQHPDAPSERMIVATLS